MDAFLKEYAASVDWVNANNADAAALIGENGIVDAAVAEKALPYCNIVCLTGSDMQAKLSGYLQVLGRREPRLRRRLAPGKRLLLRQQVIPTICAAAGTSPPPRLSERRMHPWASKSSRPRVGGDFLAAGVAAGEHGAARGLSARGAAAGLARGRGEAAGGAFCDG